MKPSKAERRKQQKILEGKQRTRDKAVYAGFIACVVLFVAIYWFKPLTIGTDGTHTFFVIVLPILAGISLLISYRKKIFNTEAIAAVTNIWHKIGLSIIIPLLASLFSFIIFGTIANLAFEISNYYAAKHSRQQTVVLPVDEFHIGRGSKAKHTIRFNFKGEKEYIKVSRNFIDQYVRETNSKHQIKLKLRKGLWNHYLVDDFDIIK
ncbi:hypothetical protein ACX0HA_07590 [Flavobacterium hauense]